MNTGLTPVCVPLLEWVNTMFGPGVGYLWRVVVGESELTLVRELCVASTAWADALRVLCEGKVTGQV